MVKGQPGQKCPQDPISTNDWVWWYASTIQASTDKRIMIKVGPGIKQDPISKIVRAKRAGGITSS
jgi:hypothetical protein